MTREEYIITRNTENFNIGQMYKFYTDAKPENEVPFNVFQQVFPMFLNFHVKAIYEYLDLYFDVHILIDKNGKFIKAL